MRINSSGPLRRLELNGDLFVVGEGFTVPCKDEQEVTYIIKMLSKNTEDTI